jgi:hypothetical protein
MRLCQASLRILKEWFVERPFIERVGAKEFFAVIPNDVAAIPLSWRVAVPTTRLLYFAHGLNPVKR